MSPFDIMIKVALFVGLIVHGFFAECLTRAPTLVTNHPNFVKRVVFPLQVLPWPMVLSASFHFSLPWLGQIHLASATFFDIGVFTLVVGSTLLILTAIAHQSVRGHRYHARMQEEAQAAQEGGR